MTDTLKPCPIDEGHHRYICMSNRSDPNRMWVQCMDCNTYTPYAVWQSLPRNEKPKPRPRTKEELIDSFWRVPGGSVEAVVTAAREDIAAMMRNEANRVWPYCRSPVNAAEDRDAARASGLAKAADEIERMP